MFREIRRNAEILREEDERNRNFLNSFNPDARIKPHQDNAVMEFDENFQAKIANDSTFNPDARIMF